MTVRFSATIKLSLTRTVPPVEFKIKFPAVVVISPLPAIPMVTFLISAPPFKLDTPDTVRVLEFKIVKLSSIRTVPPAESNVRFPVEVSIVLSFKIPILTLSIVAPPLASRRPVKVVAPETVKLVVTETPLPPKNRVPVEVSIVLLLVMPI